MAPDPRPGLRLSEAERVYLCRRLRRLDGLVVRLEQQAAAQTGCAAEALLARAAKHRERGARIRGHLRALGS
ncbi:hypothetical protein [Blastococcus sp. SYSU D00813]